LKLTLASLVDVKLPHRIAATIISIRISIYCSPYMSFNFLIMWGMYTDEEFAFP